MEDSKEIIDFLFLYMQMRNCHRWGWVGYKQFKCLITYITGIRQVDVLRSIFEKMVKEGYFIKRKINSKTDYKFIFNAST